MFDYMSKFIPWCNNVSAIIIIESISNMFRHLVCIKLINAELDTTNFCVRIKN